MQDEFKEEVSALREKIDSQETTSLPKPSPRKTGGWMERLAQMGLGEAILRMGVNLFSILSIAAAVFLAQAFYRQNSRASAVNINPPSNPVPAAESQPIPAPYENPVMQGIARAAQPHTNVPTRPRQDIVIYTVQDGDTVFGIAEKFGLEPQTILWGNYSVLLDDPHALRPGQTLNILPVDGVYWEWLGGIPFGEWAKFYGVTAADIIEFPGNKLDPNSVGDYNNANIKAGTWLIIPGGKREFVNWSAPLGVTRENPASARVLGEGVCDPVSGGAVGYGTYVYPTNKHYLSGFDYSEQTNHRGIDLAGSEGEGVYATDAGVVVYSGWNDYGYGNMIMIDHGNGFQSLYAHLSAIYRGCGQSVGQGETIGAIGSTGRSSGPHLHFELMTATWKVNPWDYLPPP
ncbi:MAG: peptidoglycan DD-metalloendopeptidase family protein [Chloroflexi bacterium]|nr:peptidoglycan DD-metalloendopeptidase family protein [Chloroflexota bacterium]